MVAVQRKAAELLEQSGSAEDAIELYIAAKGWSNAERVVLKQAPALASQGRNNVLEGWLNSFPKEYIANSAWMLYWLGGARMAYDPSQSRSYLEKAYALFESCNDVPGLFSAWAKIVDSFIHEWGDARPADHWIEALSGLTKKYNYPSAEIEAMVTASMVGILVHRQPTHPDFAFWEEKLERIVFNYPERDEKLLLGCSLMNSYNYVSGIQKATVIFKSLQQLSRKANIAPLPQLLWHLQEENYFWLTGDFQSCYQAILCGVNVAQESGVHLLDSYILAHGVFTGIAFNRPEMTKSYMEKFSKVKHSPRLLDKSLYHYTEASIEWYEKDFQKSMEHSKVAIEFAEAAGAPWPLSFCLVDYALTLFDVGRYEEAKSFHKQAGDYGKVFASAGYLYNMVGAKIYLGVGDHDRGLGFLKTAMNIGARNGYANMSRWNDQNMSRLCAKALEHNIEPEYAKKLIRTRGLLPEGAVANWPYPIRVHTLGRFELLKDDKPVTFVGKVQKKPIELLKALIAMGGQDVPEEGLIDALWPDSEGDAGYNTLKTTILRLRQLLGCEEAVLVSGGAVTLDSRLCYVDAFAFEALMREAEKNPQTAVCSRAVDLYRGSFLAADTASGWTVSLRERLRNKFLRFNLKVGKALEEQGIWAEAIEHYHRALEIDDLYEEFYQRLMSCHLQLGQYAEAASTYQRCKRTLLKTFGATLTGLTEALHQTALERKN
jgi:DNA-binding SARP family transcriptional activator